MSASASKKKRKVLDEQGLSANAVAAQKAQEQKNKTLRNVLIVVLVVAVCAAAVLGVIALVNLPSYDTSAAVMTVGNETITVPVYNIFYNTVVNDLYYNYYYSYVVQTGVPLSQQSYGDGTMEDFFKEYTNTMISNELNVVAKAKSEGFTLSDEQKETITTTLESVKTTAKSYGYPNADKFLAAYYGEGTNLEAYEDYLYIDTMYRAYSSKLVDEFQPSAEELKAEYEKDTTAYDIVNFTYMTSAATSTTVESNDAKEGEETSTASTETVYTDEAKAAAKEQAQGYAAEMPEDATTRSYSKSNVTSYFTEEIANWLFDSARKEGDVEVFARDDKGTYFYTVRFDSLETNDYHVADANVLSITKDTESTELKEGEQSSEEKWNALLAAVKDGMTDEEFSAAITALGYTYSSSTITRSYSLSEIKDFVLDASRKDGDLLTSYETDTTYYLVRFVASHEKTYRDELVTDTLLDAYAEEIASTNEAVVNEDLMKHASTDLTIQASSSQS